MSDPRLSRLPEFDQRPRAYGVQSVGHLVSSTQAELDDHETLRRTVDRRMRADAKWRQMTRRANRTPSGGTLDSARITAAIEQGVNADSQEWRDLLAEEVEAAREAAKWEAADQAYARRILDRYMRLRGYASQRQAREAAAERARARSAVGHVPLTMETLLAALGWSERYAEHRVQPYCDCDVDYDGMLERCEHALDLGLEP